MVEAMKMENALRAPRDGVVRAVHVAGGRHGGARAAAGGARAVSLPAPRHGRRGRARATACRTRRRRSRSTTAWPSATRSSPRACPSSRSGAFVSPKWVPQMAGSDEVAAAASRKPPGVRLPGAGPEPHGLRARARGRGARDRGLHGGERDASTAGTRTPRIDESFARFAELRARGEARGAARARLRLDLLRLSLRGRGRARRASSTWPAGSPRPGCDEVSIGDTIGVAVPTQVADVLGRLRRRDARAIAWPCTSTTPAARRSPTCSPRSRRASRSSTARPAASAAARTRRARRGNLATEDLLYMLARHGHRDGRRPRRGRRGLARARRAARPRAALALPPGRAARPAGSAAVSETPRRSSSSTTCPRTATCSSRRLERSGFRVVCAASGPEALDVAAAAATVDLVLLDIMMPGMTGIEVLRRRAHRAARRRRCRSIMVTAKTDSEDVVEALSLGANDYVTKPVDYPVALARIQRAPAHRAGGRAAEAAPARRAARARPRPCPGRARRPLPARDSRSAAAASAPSSARATSSSAATWR